MMDIITEIIIPCIIKKKICKYNDADLEQILDWYYSEEKLKRCEGTPCKLLNNSWYNYINNLLPPNIRIYPMTYNDSRLNGDYNEEFIYFEVEHPEGNYYCVLSDNNPPLKIKYFSEDVD